MRLIVVAVNSSGLLRYVDIKPYVFMHFHKQSMSHSRFTRLLFQSTFCNRHSKTSMKHNPQQPPSHAQNTKLEVSQSELIYEDDPSDSIMVPEKIKEEEKEQQQERNHKQQDSTLTYPAPDPHPIPHPEDDIDINDVDDLDEVNCQSSANGSSECKDGNLDSSANNDDRGPQRPRKKKKNRKVRTTITRQKLLAMNQIFAEYTKNKQEGKNPRLNLKQIGNKLCLGYSTILHKFRQFRSTKMVKGGALIASLQKKRKYKKSLIIEQIIDKALATRPFYTAVELSDYILQCHGKKFSRSIISRHLGQMGYSYKNLKSSPIEKNKPKYKQTRRVYADIVYPYLSSPAVVVLYIDELACNVATFQRRRATFNPKELYQENASDYVSLMVGATIEGILFFQIKHGFYSQSDFVNALQICLAKIVETKFGKRPPVTDSALILITDMNKIHLDPFDSDHKPLKALLKRYNTRRFYLPPASPHLNPLESMFTHLKTKLLKKDIKSSSDLRNYMQACMQQMSSVSVEVYFQDTVKCVQASRSDDSFSFQDKPSGCSFDSL